MRLPTREDINVYNSLDEQKACDHFFGKTIEQAEALFKENACCYQEDLMWMGPVAFRYYVNAAIHYIQSESATGDSDIVNCFAGLLEFRLEHESTELVPVAEQLVAICGYIIEHYERFDLVPEIYGDVHARLQKLQQTFLQMLGHPS